MPNMTHPHKKRRISDLPAELLEVILTKLPFVDNIRSSAVCSSWNSATTQTPLCAQTPWLMLPSDQEHDFTTCRFFNLAENKVYKMKNVFEGLGYDVWCVGSSHGWLVILDDEANPHLFNPFSRVQIQLPLFTDELANVNNLRKSFITKAILLADPSRSNDFVVVMIYDYDFASRLAFYKQGDKTWTKLVGANQDYCDIICHDNQLYALADNRSVEVWEFQSSSPTKIMSIEPSMQLKDVEKFPRNNNISTKFYLVKTSNDDVLFIERFIGNFVNAQGFVVDESYLLSSNDTQPLVCPYRTKMFFVFKLDFKLKRWEKVESLKDQVVFLGGNQSMSVSSHDLSECKPNSIYFTDDRWYEMDLDNLYGGHDLGLFNLDNESIKPFYHSDLEKIDPPPFWITPNPW
uniref:F-box domain-containing protein n=1 Tax=Fagus sylvatica TaxID=28930 RepID=A0A2N9FZ77_FAGSY